MLYHSTEVVNLYEFIFLSLFQLKQLEFRCHPTRKLQQPVAYEVMIIKIRLCLSFFSRDQILNSNCISKKLKKGQKIKTKKNNKRQEKVVIWSIHLLIEKGKEIDLSIDLFIKEKFRVISHYMC